ncbi:hypothetical protein CEXT_456861 [Caerostris extrusa]|uniref:Uncharacterized protein n=1 Tax=Caerostris extrusa TaxID=172846 RepID=A0AAV4RMB3_CAEEX|nr:hypothetical protein CEXT_456861 [Caerostris extrusa]
MAAEWREIFDRTSPGISSSDNNPPTLNPNCRALGCARHPYFRTRGNDLGRASVIHAAFARLRLPITMVQVAVAWFKHTFVFHN